MLQASLTVYQDLLHQYREEAKNNKRQLTGISILRVLLFLLFAWFLYASFKERFSGNDLAYAIFFILGFLVSVSRAEVVKKKNAFLQQLILINENEINVCKGLPSFLDDGASFATAKGFTADLSVFGKYSLFQLVNRTGSLSGKQALFFRLSNPFTDAKSIQNYQACLRELAGKTGFSQSLLAHTLLLKEVESLPALQSEIPEGKFTELTNRFWSILATAWPVTGAVLVIFSVWKDNYRPLIAFGILGLFLLSFVFRKTSALYQQISKRSYLYGQYAICFRLITAESFVHPYLIQKQKEISEAAGAFQRLSKLSGLFDLRLNLFSFLINGLFLFELLCARAYLSWNRQNQGHLKNWFATMGEFELLHSLATFHFNNPSFIFPELVTDRLVIRASALGHPLMKENEAVKNDVSIGDTSKLHLITGSNMSGKSTFLRTLGMNMILAQSGAPVFAKSFEFHPVRLLTSFHHIDSLEESTSYFYAELKCLQEIIESLTAPVPAMVLLDEVMRGTNSQDKHDGTALLIKKILRYPCLTFIATHDIELGILAQSYPGQIENFCFESELTENSMHFDFTMRRGVAQTKNATYLMKQMGII